MTNTLLAGAVAMVCGGLFLLVGQETSTPAVFTEAQAAAGRTAYRSTCGKCHTESLLGRTGDPAELPPVSSLPKNMQDVVQTAGGMVPPLAGPDFLAVWGARATSDLSRRVKEAVGGFPPEGSDKETYLNLTAYFLQTCGARAGTQALTASTAVEIRSLMPGTTQKR
jgi:hypothetical protein